MPIITTTLVVKGAVSLAIFIGQTVAGNYVYNGATQSELFWGPQQKSKGAVTIEEIKYKGEAKQGEINANQEENIDKEFIDKLNPHHIGAIYKDYFVFDKVTSPVWETQWTKAKAKWEDSSNPLHYQWTKYKYFSTHNFGWLKEDNRRIAIDCQHMMSKTPRRSWWDGSGKLDWDLLWDLCVKPEKQNSQKPEKWWYSDSQ